MSGGDWPEPNYTLIQLMRGLGDHSSLLAFTREDHERFAAIGYPYTGEIYQEARASHHMLDLIGVPGGLPQGPGDLDVRVSRLIQRYAALAELLGRISDWHARETGPAGTVGDYCTECRQEWPCDTRRLSDGTYVDYDDDAPLDPRPGPVTPPSGPGEAPT